MPDFFFPDKIEHVHTLQTDAVLKRFLLWIGFVSILCSDAIRNTNPNNSAPLKKVERSDFGIYFTKCETEKGSRKNNFFSSKNYISGTVQLKSSFFCHFVYSGHC